MSQTAATNESRIIELRQYTLHPGKLDSFIPLFEREFIETQEAVGMRVIGQFRDLDNPNRFVWLRSFPDMPARAESLQAFYGGPVWQANREAANAHFIDTDDVLLLRQAGDAGDGAQRVANRAPPGASIDASGIVVVTIYALDEPADEFAPFFHQVMQPLLDGAGLSVLLSLETEPSVNNFPRLPIREGENVFVWIAAFAREEDYRAGYARLSQLPQWRDTLAPSLRRRLKATPQVLRLKPTPRSALHG
ncbi:MAG: NIPSNAP family protein [Rudaea sp.]